MSTATYTDHSRKRFPLYILWLVLVLMLPGSGIAKTVYEIYQQALEADPSLKIAGARFKVARESARIAGSTLLPQVTASYEQLKNKQFIEGRQFDTYNTTSKTYSASMAIFDLASWFSFMQAKRLSKAERLRFAYAQQELIVRVISAYLEVLKAQENLRVAQAEKLAFGHQLKQSQVRLEVGLSAITDVHESQLQYDLARVRLIQAEGGLVVSREALRAITGEAPPPLVPFSAELPIQMPTPLNRDAWVEIALRENKQLAVATASVQAAKNGRNAGRSIHLPVISATASDNISTTDSRFSLAQFASTGIGPTGSELDSRNKAYGLRAHISLISGGRDLGNQRRAAYQYQEAVATEIAARRSIVQNTRSLHQQVETSVNNVAARLQAIRSARSAYDATQVGYEVGTRNLVDLLQAQRILYAAQRDYISARYDYILILMRLRQVSGGLNPEDVMQLNKWHNHQPKKQDDLLAPPPSSGAGISPAEAS